MAGTKLASRTDLALLCNQRGVKCAVEVGTDRGLFARDFLRVWTGSILFCVDPWEPYGHMPYDRSGDLAMAVAVLAPFADRCRIIRAKSPDIARYLAEHRPGFIYIDGDHDYQPAAADVNAWWSVLGPGTILAGHDYCPDAVGVRRAVDELVARHKLTLGLTGDRPASWYVEKAK